MGARRSKAIHGLRELAKEVAVIVLGVAIALTAGQIVDAFHWRQEVAATRQALDRETAFNLGVVKRRLEEAPCLDHKLDDLRLYFLRHAKDAAAAPVGAVGQPQFRRTHSNVWEVAKADQVMSHFSLPDQLRYAQLYDGFEWLRERQLEESVEWTKLAELDDFPSLEKEDWSQLRLARARAKALADKVDFSAPSLLHDGLNWVKQPIDEGVGLSSGALLLCKRLT